jgi:hypothetical protein
MPRRIRSAERARHDRVRGDLDPVSHRRHALLDQFLAITRADDGDILRPHDRQQRENVIDAIWAGYTGCKPQRHVSRLAGNGLFGGICILVAVDVEESGASTGVPSRCETSEQQWTLPTDYNRHALVDKRLRDRSPGGEHHVGEGRWRDELRASIPLRLRRLDGNIAEVDYIVMLRQRGEQPGIAQHARRERFSSAPAGGVERNPDDRHPHGCSCQFNQFVSGRYQSLAVSLDG